MFINTDLVTVTKNKIHKSDILNIIDYDNDMYFVLNLKR